MNLLGLGFAFSAVDKGLGAILSNSSDGFFKLGQSFEAAGALARNFTSAGMNLTTDYEASLTQMGAASKRFGSRVALVGDSIDEMARNNARFSNMATSMALRLNMSAEEAGAAISAFDTMDQSIRATFGFKNADQVAKFARITGVSATEIRDQLKALDTMFGHEEAGIKIQQEFIDSVVASGKQTRDLTGALRMQADVIRLMRRVQNLGIDGADKWGAQVYELSGIMKEYTGNVDEARLQSLALSSKVVESQEQLRDMFSGISKNMPELAEQLGIGIGDIRKALDNIREGPAGMVRALSFMSKAGKADARGLTAAWQFFASRLQSVLGPELQPLLTAMIKRGPEAIDKISASVKKVRTPLGELGDKLDTTAYTTDQRLKLMEQSFLTRFRNLGRGEGKRLLDDLGQEFKHWGDDIQKAAKKGDAFGNFIKKLSELSSLGPVALLPKEFQASAVVFGNMMDALSPVIVQIETMQRLATGLLNPFNILTGAVGIILFKYQSMLHKGLSPEKARKATVEMITKFVRNTVDALKKFMSKDMPEVAATIRESFMVVKDTLSESWDELAKTDTYRQGIDSLEKGLSFVWGKIYGFYQSEIKPQAERLFDGFTTALFGGHAKDPNSAFTQIGLELGNGVRSAWKFVLGVLDSELPGIMKAAVGFAWKAIKEAYKAYPNLLPAMAMFYGGMNGGAFGFFSALAASLGVGFSVLEEERGERVRIEQEAKGSAAEQKAGEERVRAYKGAHPGVMIPPGSRLYKKLYDEGIKTYRYNQLPENIRNDAQSSLELNQSVADSNAYIAQATDTGNDIAKASDAKLERIMSTLDDIREQGMSRPAPTRRPRKSAAVDTSNGAVSGAGGVN